MISCLQREDKTEKKNVKKKLDKIPFFSVQLINTNLLIISNLTPNPSLFALKADFWYASIQTFTVS